MTEGNFVDYVKMHVASGNGGKGSAHLRREKYVAKGGPDGGDGGRGGHVIVKGNKNLWTLVHFKFKKHFKAGHGEHGSKSRSTGADGEDVYMEVPLGTVIRDTETNEILFEITELTEFRSSVISNRLTIVLPPRCTAISKLLVLPVEDLSSSNK